MQTVGKKSGITFNFTTALMCTHSLKLEKEANMIKRAVLKSIDEGIVTEDILTNNPASTSEVGDWLVDYILNKIEAESLSE